MSRYLIDELDAARNIDVLFETEVVGGGGDGRLERLVLTDRRTGSHRTVEAAALLVLVGANPHRLAARFGGARPLGIRAHRRRPPEGRGGPALAARATPAVA
jgi:hypothetical protein